VCERAIFDKTTRCEEYIEIYQMPMLRAINLLFRENKEYLHFGMIEEINRTANNKKRKRKGRKKEEEEARIDFFQQ